MGWDRVLRDAAVDETRVFKHHLEPPWSNLVHTICDDLVGARFI